MFVGPDHPLFRERFGNDGRVGGDRVWGGDGWLPQGAVPPGARFDPVGPAVSSHASWSELRSRRLVVMRLLSDTERALMLSPPPLSALFLLVSERPPSAWRSRNRWVWRRKRHRHFQAGRRRPHPPTSPRSRWRSRLGRVAAARELIFTCTPIVPLGPSLRSIRSTAADATPDELTLTLATIVSGLVRERLRCDVWMRAGTWRYGRHSLTSMSSESSASQDPCKYFVSQCALPSTAERRL